MVKSSKKTKPKKAPSHPPLRIGSNGKRETRTQFAALPFRRKKDAFEMLLITSRATGRWLIPKGWPMDGLTPHEAAAQEAWEEAGIRGRVFPDCIGIYSYSKWLDEELSLPCIVPVFAIEVAKLDDAYPEASYRKRKWMSPKKAAARVDEPELKHLIRQFDPTRLR